MERDVVKDLSEQIVEAREARVAEALAAPERARALVAAVAEAARAAGVYKVRYAAGCTEVELELAAAPAERLARACGDHLKRHCNGQQVDLPAPAPTTATDATAALRRDAPVEDDEEKCACGCPPHAHSAMGCLNGCGTEVCAAKVPTPGE